MTTKDAKELIHGCYGGVHQCLVRIAGGISVANAIMRSEVKDVDQETLDIAEGAEQLVKNAVKLVGLLMSKFEVEDEDDGREQTEGCNAGDSPLSEVSLN